MVLAERFVDDGFVRIEQAVPADVVAACAAELWAEIGYAADDPSTWTEPVRWVGGMDTPPFAAAASAPPLVAAFDTLVGAGRWAPRYGLGSFPLRFPHPDEPDDAGWHVEGSYAVDGTDGYWLNLRSRRRALLMLFLFTDVGPEDAPTRIRVGSHLDVPPLLAPNGERGVPMMRIAAAVDAASAHRPVELATGRAGDVFLCHPFLVHAAQPHHGTRPRFLAQPPLHPDPLDGMDLDRPDASPVERAVHRALRP